MWLVRISIALGIAALGVAVSFLVFGGAPVDVGVTQVYPTPGPTESVPLAPACNPVTSTYPDDTAIQTLADAVSPPGSLRSLWIFNMGTWLGFSPQYPQVSDLMKADMLDVLFVCVFDPGEFLRPMT